MPLVQTYKTKKSAVVQSKCSNSPIRGDDYDNMVIAAEPSPQVLHQFTAHPSQC